MIEVGKTPSNVVFLKKVRIGRKNADFKYILWNCYPDVLEGSCPPHFHALHSEYEVLIDIRTMEILEGHFPKRALSLVLEWTSEHRKELMEDWELCAQNQMPKPIKPLE